MGAKYIAFILVIVLALSISKPIIADHSVLQALIDKLLLYSQAEYDVLFERLRAMVEGATEFERMLPAEMY